MKNSEFLKLSVWTLRKEKKNSFLRRLVSRHIGLLHEVEETHYVLECDVDFAITFNENGAK
jgi:hypothetical protein